jgi:hypothetical protein
MAVSLTYAATCTVVETIANNTGSATEANRKVTHTEHNRAANLSATTTPAVTLTANFLLTLTTGAATIDLRDLTGTNGASVDGNGLKVIAVQVTNLGANPMTFSSGASNGHNTFTEDGTVVSPGGTIQIFTNDNGDDISGTTKTWDVAGTGSQTAKVTIVMG